MRFRFVVDISSQDFSEVISLNGAFADLTSCSIGLRGNWNPPVPESYRAKLHARAFLLLRELTLE